MPVPLGGGGTVPGMTTASTEPDYLPKRQAWLAMIPLCIGFFMNLLDQSIVSVATPDIQDSFGVDYNALIWVNSSFFLAYAIPLLVTGRLGDQLGQKRVFQVGIFVFTVASLWCGMAGSIESLIAARALQGIGAALIAPQTLSVITRIFAPDHRGTAMGLWGTVAGLATLTGPVLGGLIVDVAGWSWIFYINVPVGIACMILAAMWVPDLPSTSRSFDIPSITVSILAMTFLVVGIQQGESAGWTLWIWGLLAAAAALIVLFVRLQKSAEPRGVEALVPLDLFSRLNFSRGTFSIMAMGFAVASNAVPIMLYMQRYENIDPLMAGLMIAPMAIVSGVLAPFVGSWIGKIAPRTLSMIGFGMMIVGQVLMFAVMRPELPVWWIAVASIALGVGNGFVWAPNSTTTMYSIPPSSAGAASGVYNTSRQVGAVIGSAATAAFIQFRTAQDAGAYVFGEVLLMQAAVLVLGFIAVMGFTRPGSPTPKQGQAGSSNGV